MKRSDWGRYAPGVLVAAVMLAPSLLTGCAGARTAQNGNQGGAAQSIRVIRLLYRSDGLSDDVDLGSAPRVGLLDGGA
jgi:hypothetical protein